MTIRDLIQASGGRIWEIIAVLALPLLAALVLTVLLPRNRAAHAPWKHFYSFLVYLTCIPGMLSLVLTAYTIFFTHENILDVNVTVYFLPVVCMVLTLFLIGREVPFDALPGFDRLFGLMVMMAASFAIVLVISRTRIWLVFGGSFAAFLAWSAALFALLKWGAGLLTGKSDRPKPPVPPEW